MMTNLNNFIDLKDVFENLINLKIKLKKRDNLVK